MGPIHVTLRVLSASGFRPKKTLEFHWYSAEEVGLLGSQAIAQSYKKSNKQVTAMLQVRQVKCALAKAL